jgi:hypothetical protein
MFLELNSPGGILLFGTSDLLYLKVLTTVHVYQLNGGVLL